MKWFFVLFAVVGFCFESFTQDYFWVAFSDKNNSDYSLNQPEEFLSERAIQRRIKQNILIDSLDLPVNQNYIDSVLSLGVEFVHASKWLNGITVKSQLENFKNQVSQFHFVDSVQLTKPASASKSAQNKFAEFSVSNSEPIDTTKYGLSVFQTSIMNGQFLHNQNYFGQGIHIAVLDGGFTNVNNFVAFDSLWANNQILGIRDFVEPNSDFYGTSTSSHGMSVLSCMGGNVPGQLLGTSPKASFWLLRSEDTHSEYIVEEDHWAVAAEFADSVGADIINSSLGYFNFQDPSTNHSYADMDGKTTRVTRAANVAASRGILVFSSAGNEGNDPWKYIIAPSDGEQVIGVAAVDKYGEAAAFTSFGPAANGTIKPDVAALGRNTFLQKSNGELGFGSGTSYASPVLAGMAACLWQAHPNATARQVKDAIIYSAHLIANPDERLGYGIPDFKTAWLLLLNLNAKTSEVENKWTVFPNPFYKNIHVNIIGNSTAENIEVEMFSLQGVLLKKIKNHGVREVVINEVNHLPSGIYFIRVKTDEYAETVKLTKTN